MSDDRRDWWEHAQPKGAKPAPLWLKALFVVSLTTRALSGGEPPAWPTRPRGGDGD